MHIFYLWRNHKVSMKLWIIFSMEDNMKPHKNRELRKDADKLHKNIISGFLCKKLRCKSTFDCSEDFYFVWSIQHSDWKTLSVRDFFPPSYLLCCFFFPIYTSLFFFNYANSNILRVYLTACKPDIPITCDLVEAETSPSPSKWKHITIFKHKYVDYLGEI